MKTTFLCIHKIDELISTSHTEFDYKNIWISPISHIFRKIEDFKINGKDEIFINGENTKYKSCTDLGVIYSVGLTRDKIEKFIQSDFSYFEIYCDKSKNPMLLSDEISLLKIDDTDFWDEEIIIEMKNC